VYVSYRVNMEVLWRSREGFIAAVEQLGLGK
jgi:hypothetical protein